MVQYKYSSHRTRRIKKIRKQREKYPELAQKIIETSDIILQVLDSRFLSETRNEELENLIKKKKKTLINVLNKSDLINIDKVKKSELKKLEPYIFVSAFKRLGGQRLRTLIRREALKIENLEKKKMKGQKIKEIEEEKITVGVLGYPNIGKSSLINLLIGKSSAGVGSDAGYTRGVQKLKLSEDIVLIDSPGVIPKKQYSHQESDKIAHHTVFGGRSYSQVKNAELVVSEIMKKFPGTLERYYKIKANGNPELLIEKIGEQKNIFKKKGEVDEDKTSRMILKDWQEGKIRIL